MIKSKWVISISFSLILVTTVFSQVDDQEKYFNLIFEEQSFDFGKLDSDTLVTHLFKFKNISADTININNVGSS
jgi:hypothetical protein